MHARWHLQSAVQYHPTKCDNYTLHVSLLLVVETKGFSQQPKFFLLASLLAVYSPRLSFARFAPLLASLYLDASGLQRSTLTSLRRIRSHSPG